MQVRWLVVLLYKHKLACLLAHNALCILLSKLQANPAELASALTYSQQNQTPPCDDGDVLALQRASAAVTTRVSGVLAFLLWRFRLGATRRLSVPCTRLVHSARLERNGTDWVKSRVRWYVPVIIIKIN